MDIMKNYRLVLLLLVPFFLGWLVNSSSFLSIFYAEGIWIFSIGFLMYWFWIGRQFGQLKSSKIIHVLSGNIIWAISFGLYIWQFILADDVSRNMGLAGISQHYGLFTVAFAAKIVSTYADVIDGTQVMIASYIIMLVIFMTGFIYESIRASKVTDKMHC